MPLETVNINVKTLPFSQAGTLSTGTGVGRARIEGKAEILDAYAEVDTAPTGSSIILDVRKNGTTIYTGGTNRPTIAAGAHNGSQAGPPAVTSAAADDYVTVDIIQVGSTIAGANLTVFVRYRLL